ncbi:zinc ribbon domain-containing protein YjdM [Corynebacterium casei]|uniref:zinc ribbon domain-containing protein YjdM n=1 Tax=Corynebacterium casei TaxID=160386 RepID=UPI003FD67E0E
MSDTLAPCPECSSEFTYENAGFLVCPMCAHEWVDGEAGDDDAAAADASVIKDSVGNVLIDGDSVSIVKSLKVKGSSAIKIGTKVSGIRILETPVAGHDIEAKVPGFGQMRLKSSVVKKS